MYTYINLLSSEHPSIISTHVVTGKSQALELPSGAQRGYVRAPTAGEHPPICGVMKQQKQTEI